MTTHTIDLDLSLEPGEAPPAPSTLGADEISGAFVATVNGNSQNGEMYILFKEPGSQRITVHRLDVSSEPFKAIKLGVIPGAFFKSGEGNVLFGPNGRGYTVTTESPDPTTGAAARVIVSDDIPIVVGKDGRESGGAGGGAIGIIPPDGFIRVKSVTLKDPPFEGQQTISLADFKIPPSVHRLKLKVCASAATSGTQGRAGPSSSGSGAAMVTAVCQAPGVRMFAEGDREPGPNGTLLLWADKGPLREFFVDVMEYWP